MDDGCVGSPMRNVSLSLNEEGCLEVRSQAVGETYWPESSPTLREGRFQTHDLADLYQGQVYLRGRRGDVINVAGRKVSPEAIEKVLLSHPQVRGCLVFGVRSNSSERADTIVAYVATTVPLEERSLKRFLLERLPAWQVPREWRFQEIEPNIRGKLSRAEWRNRYLAGRR
jgi:long-chain acyl-CoA synthetase